MIYNPITENSYISGSPSNTLWRALPSYSVNSDYYAYGVLAIIYVPKYLPGTVGSIYSIPDNKYYDINFISWTSGNGQGWPGGGSDGSGGGGGGGVGGGRGSGGVVGEAVDGGPSVDGAGFQTESVQYAMPPVEPSDDLTFFRSF